MDTCSALFIVSLCSIARKEKQPNWLGVASKNVVLYTIKYYSTVNIDHIEYINTELEIHSSYILSYLWIPVLGLYMDVYSLK